MQKPCVEPKALRMGLEAKGHRELNRSGNIT